MSAHATQYRECVGSFPTGVTVVTAVDGDRLAGMTLNSFTSVSLDPLLVLVSLAHRTRTLDVARASGRVAISILHGGQSDVALAFAANGAPFPVDLVEVDEDGHALVRDALATLRCAVRQTYQAGDHDLLVCEVDDFERRRGTPLVFHRGEFAGLHPDPRAEETR